MRIHHIGYLVKKLDKARKAFERLGYTVTQEPVYDPYRKIDICFMELDGYVIELVSPAAPDSVVSALIKQYRNSPYHICYIAEHFEKEAAELCEKGFVQIGEPCPAPAIGQKRVLFLMSPAIGIIELLEA